MILVVMFFNQPISVSTMPVGTPATVSLFLESVKGSYKGASSEVSPYTYILP